MGVFLSLYVNLLVLLETSGWVRIHAIPKALPLIHQDVARNSLLSHFSDLVSSIYSPLKSTEKGVGLPFGRVIVKNFAFFFYLNLKVSLFGSSLLWAESVWSLSILLIYLLLGTKCVPPRGFCGLILFLFSYLILLTAFSAFSSWTHRKPSISYMIFFVS